jgi:UDP-GlcNAc:undecaprenyl-phosphate/decaprenyl-phosphate GlcNAc-1-phosphate transferase
VTLLYLGIFASSLLISFLLTRYVRATCVARGWVAAPSSDRHMHSRPVPRLGGVAIFLAFLLTVGGALLVAWWRPSLDIGVTFGGVAQILLPGLVIFALGAYDDVHPLGPYVKFSVQIAAAGMVFAFGLRILDLPVLVGHHTHFSWVISLPLTILWVLAITNAFNLIDGLDGLASGAALFSTLVVFVVAVFSHATLVSLLTLALAGAILGFLRYNFNPATILLGDCGSLFIGFVLSALALQGAQKSPTIIAVAIPVVSFGLPILETFISVSRRFISGRPLFTGDREHIHHKLLQLGLSHSQVVIVLYAVSAIFALLSLFLLYPTGSTLGLVLLVLGTGVWLGVQHLGYLEFGELRRVAQRTMEQRQIVVNNLAIRRAMEELKVAQSFEQVCQTLAAAFSVNDFDSFELRCGSHPGQVPKVTGMQIIPENGESCIYWRRLGSQFTPNAANAWSLTLNLLTGNSRPLGSFIIYRLYCGRDLQFDVNLLTSVFPTVLAEALDHVIARPVETVVGYQEDSGMMAARAGG